MTGNGPSSSVGDDETSLNDTEHYEAGPDEYGPDDARLLDQTRSGDADAYGLLYQRHEGAARRLAWHIAGSAADADDIVAETFARVLGAIRRGNGPQGTFRPYMLTAVRRVAYDRFRARRAEEPTDESLLLDPGEPFADPAVAGLEAALIAEAFASLPHRWSTVLWHTEVEGETPAQVAPLLGLSPNGVAQLRRRAREGLRQAYLQVHISRIARPECVPAASLLGGFVRDALSRRDTRMVKEHLDHCSDCRGLCAELTDVNAALRGLAAPVLGPLAGAYLAGQGAAHAGRLGWLGRLRHASRPRRQLTLGAAVGAALIALIGVAYALTGHGTPLRHHGQPEAAGSPAPGHRRPDPRHARTPTAGHPGSSTAPGRRSTRLSTSPSPTPSRSSPHPTPPATSPPPTTAPPTTPPPTTPPTTSPPPPANRLDPSVTLKSAPGRSVAWVSFRVTNTSSGPTGALSATLTLPPDTSAVGSGYGWDGWSCKATAAGANCRHASLAPGGLVGDAFLIDINGPAACGRPTGLTMKGSASAPDSATSAGVIRCHHHHGLLGFLGRLLSTRQVNARQLEAVQPGAEAHDVCLIRSGKCLAIRAAGR